MSLDTTTMNTNISTTMNTNISLSVSGTSITVELSLPVTSSVTISLTNDKTTLTAKVNTAPATEVITEVIEVPDIEVIEVPDTEVPDTKVIEATDTEEIEVPDTKVIEATDTEEEATDTEETQRDNALSKMHTVKEWKEYYYSKLNSINDSFWTKFNTKFAKVPSRDLIDMFDIYHWREGLKALNLKQFHFDEDDLNSFAELFFAEEEEQTYPEDNEGIDEYEWEYEREDEEENEEENEEYRRKVHEFGHRPKNLPDTFFRILLKKLMAFPDITEEEKQLIFDIVDSYEMGRYFLTTI
jgi:hypothetical protein